MAFFPGINVEEGNAGRWWDPQARPILTLRIRNNLKGLALAVECQPDGLENGG